MGFWHTGYFEFHEPAGLEGCVIEPSPLQHNCSLCNTSFPSIEELRQHRFEDHPACKPSLYVQGREVGAHPLRITRRLTSTDVRIEECESVTLNGENVSPSKLPFELSRKLSETCCLVLRTGDVASEFTLEFCVASEAHLRGVDDAFARLAARQRLDQRTIDDFNVEAERFHSARAYYGGVSDYLYGVLAKERSKSNLSYRAYIDKYNRAGEELAPYETGLARAIRSIIAFHFNHFATAVDLSATGRIGYVSVRYESCLKGAESGFWVQTKSTASTMNVDAWLTDWHTEQIIRWASRSFSEVGRILPEIEAFSNSGIADYDRSKLQVLLSEAYYRSGDVGAALRHAKTLRNLPGFARWAERLIQNEPQQA